MKLLVDIGNSRTKYLEAKDIYSQSCRVIENHQLNLAWLNKFWSAAEEIVLANVSQQTLTDLIMAWATANNIKVQVIKSEQQRLGIKSFYLQPEQLGVDRWLTLLAAASLFPQQNVLIVDAGTATTFDCLNASGQHFGGWILPGINLMFESLLANTAQVDASKLTKPSLSFGATSSENVNNACWAATVGTIELAIRQAEMVLETLDIIVMTGGNAQSLKPLLLNKTHIVDNLVFHGLHRYLSA